jgi:hypothetical protein
MRSFELIAASVCLAAGAWVANAGGTSGIEIDEFTTGSISSAGQTYVMRSVETAAACQIDKGAAVANGMSPVTLYGACEAVLPSAQRIRYWRDRDDGSVELVGAGTETVVVFGIGDGVDFESYRPASPLLSLSSRG